MKQNELGLIEYCGEIIPITWDEYLSLIWNKDPQIEILSVPKRTKEEKKYVK